MRLNCHILMDELSKLYDVHYYGPKASDLHLKRPEIYNIYDKAEIFQKNRTYCLTTLLLPAVPHIQEGALLICVGKEAVPFQYRNLDNGCIWLNEPGEKIIRVFNDVQRIFDKYDDWEHQLQTILYSTANIQEMVDACTEILDNPIIVIDGTLRFLGYSRIIDSSPRLKRYRHGPDGKVQQQNLSPYLEYQKKLPLSGITTDTDINMENYSRDIHYQGRYLGNISMPFAFTPRRYSDQWILSVLYDYISRALAYYQNNPAIQSNILRSAFRELISGNPLNDESAEQLNRFAGTYICLRLSFSSRIPGQVALVHLCSYIENSLPHCICFEHGDSMIAFLDVSEELPDMKKFLTPLLEEMQLYAGVSHPFSNLSQARYYYQQAHAAQKLGRSAGKEGRYFLFQEHILSFLLGNCCGELPVESLYSQGLWRLSAHDSASKTSYFETLQVYLKNSMNITKTAMDLNIHRTTFLERLRYIEAMLDDTLDNPDYRLYLEIILRQLHPQS